MSYELKTYTIYSDEVLSLIEEIDKEVFDSPYSISKMKERTRNKNISLILFYFFDGRPVAFKAGFEEKDKFHSWIGGVLPIHRGKGLASKLMAQQHQWAKDNGFSIVRTHTEDQYSNMIKLNQKHGFKIIDRQTRNSGVEKIILEKVL